MSKYNKKLLNKLLLIGTELLVLSQCKGDGKTAQTNPQRGNDIKHIINNLKDNIGNIKLIVDYEDKIRKYENINEIFASLFENIRSNGTIINSNDEEIKSLIKILKETKNNLDGNSNNEANILRSYIEDFLNQYDGNVQSANQQLLTINEWLTQYNVFDLERNNFYESLKRVKSDERFLNSDQISQLIKNFQKSKANNNFDLTVSNEVSVDSDIAFQNFVKGFFPPRESNAKDKNLFISSADSRNILPEWFKILSELAINQTRYRCKILTKESMQIIFNSVNEGSILEGNDIVEHIYGIFVSNEVFTREEMFNTISCKFGDGSITDETKQKYFLSLLKDTDFTEDQRKELSRIFGQKFNIRILETTAANILKELNKLDLSLNFDTLKQQIEKIYVMSPDEFVQFLKIIYEKSEENSKQANIFNFVRYVYTNKKLSGKLVSKHLWTDEGIIKIFSNNDSPTGIGKEIIRQIFKCDNFLNCVENSITNECIQAILSLYTVIDDEKIKNIILKAQNNSLNSDSINKILELTNNPVTVFNNGEVFEKISEGALSIYQNCSIINKLTENQNDNDDFIARLFSKVNINEANSDCFSEEIQISYSNVTESEIVFDVIFKHCTKKSVLFTNKNILKSMNTGTVGINFFNQLLRDDEFSKNFKDENIDSFAELVLKISIPYKDNASNAIDIGNVNNNEKALIENILNYLKLSSNFSESVKKVFKALRKNEEDNSKNRWIKFNLPYFELFKNCTNLNSDALEEIIKQCFPDDGSAVNDYLKICNILINVSNGHDNMFRILDSLFSIDSNSLEKIVPADSTVGNNAARALQSTNIDGDKSIFDLISAKIETDTKIEYASSVQYSIAYIIRYLSKAGMFDTKSLYSFVECLGRKLPLSILNGTKSRNSAENISCICPEQTSGGKNIEEFSALLYDIYLTGSNFEGNSNAKPHEGNGLDAGIIAEIFKKFSAANTLSYKANIAVLTNSDNSGNFDNDNKKEEFANIMLLLVKKEQLLDLGKKIFLYTDKHDGTGTTSNFKFNTTKEECKWQFFQNIVNIAPADKIDSCGYKEFLCFLNLFKDQCKNVFDVSQKEQWAVVNTFYKNWIKAGSGNINIADNTPGHDEAQWSHLRSLAYIVNMDALGGDKIMCKQAWEDILTMFQGKELKIDQVNVLFNLAQPDGSLLANPLTGIDMHNAAGSGTLIQDWDTKGYGYKFFDILDHALDSANTANDHFIKVIGNANVIGKIIGNVQTNNNVVTTLGLKTYLEKLIAYSDKIKWKVSTNINTSDGKLTPAQMQSILTNHNAWSGANKIDDNVTNRILDLVAPSVYNDLFKTGAGNLNIQSHMNAADLSIPDSGTLKHQTISRIITQGTGITHTNKDILAQYYFTTDKSAENWLNAIGNLFQQGVKINMMNRTNAVGGLPYLEAAGGPDPYKINTAAVAGATKTIEFIIKYMKDFVSQCMTGNQYVKIPASFNSYQELFEKLGGTNWSPHALCEICDGSNHTLKDSSGASFSTGVEGMLPFFINQIASKPSVLEAFLNALYDTRCCKLLPYIPDYSVDYNGGNLTPKNFVENLLLNDSCCKTPAGTKIKYVNELIEHLSSTGPCNQIQLFVKKFKKAADPDDKITVEKLFKDPTGVPVGVSNVFKGRLSCKNMHKLVKECKYYGDSTLANHVYSGFERANSTKDHAKLTKMLIAKNSIADYVYNVLLDKTAKNIFYYITRYPDTNEYSSPYIREISNAINLAQKFNEQTDPSRQIGNSIPNLASNLVADSQFLGDFIISLSGTQNQRKIFVVLGNDGLGKQDSGGSGQLTTEQSIKIALNCEKETFPPTTIIKDKEVNTLQYLAKEFATGSKRTVSPGDPDPLYSKSLEAFINSLTKDQRRLCNVFAGVKTVHDYIQDCIKKNKTYTAGDEKIKQINHAMTIGKACKTNAYGDINSDKNLAEVLATGEDGELTNFMSILDDSQKNLSVVFGNNNLDPLKSTGFKAGSGINIAHAKVIGYACEDVKNIKPGSLTNDAKLAQVLANGTTNAKNFIAALYDQKFNDVFDNNKTDAKGFKKGSNIDIADAIKIGYACSDVNSTNDAKLAEVLANGTNAKNFIDALNSQKFNNVFDNNKGTYAKGFKNGSKIKIEHAKVIGYACSDVQNIKTLDLTDDAKLAQVLAQLLASGTGTNAQNFIDALDNQKFNDVFDNKKNANAKGFKKGSNIDIAYAIKIACACSDVKEKAALAAMKEKAALAAMKEKAALAEMFANDAYALQNFTAALKDFKKLRDFDTLTATEKVTKLFEALRRAGITDASHIRTIIFKLAGLTDPKMEDNFGGICNVINNKDCLEAIRKSVDFKNTSSDFKNGILSSLFVQYKNTGDFEFSSEMTHADAAQVFKVLFNISLPTKDDIFKEIFKYDINEGKFTYGENVVKNVINSLNDRKLGNINRYITSLKQMLEICKLMNYGEDFDQMIKLLYPEGFKAVFKKIKELLKKTAKVNDPLAGVTWEDIENMGFSLETLNMLIKKMNPFNIDINGKHKLSDLIISKPKIGFVRDFENEKSNIAFNEEYKGKKDIIPMLNKMYLISHPEILEKLYENEKEKDGNVRKILNIKNILQALIMTQTKIINIQYVNINQLKDFIVGIVKNSNSGYVKGNIKIVTPKFKDEIFWVEYGVIKEMGDLCYDDIKDDEIKNIKYKDTGDVEKTINTEGIIKFD